MYLTSMPTFTCSRIRRLGSLTIFLLCRLLLLCTLFSRSRVLLFLDRPLPRLWPQHNVEMLHLLCSMGFLLPYFWPVKEEYLSSFLHHPPPCIRLCSTIARHNTIENGDDGRWDSAFCYVYLNLHWGFRICFGFFTLSHSLLLLQSTDHKGEEDEGGYDMGIRFEREWETWPREKVRFNACPLFAALLFSQCRTSWPSGFLLQCRYNLDSVLLYLKTQRFVFVVLAPCLVCRMENLELLILLLDIVLLLKIIFFYKIAKNNIKIIVIIYI